MASQEVWVEICLILKDPLYFASHPVIRCGITDRNVKPSLIKSLDLTTSFSNLLFFNNLRQLLMRIIIGEKLIIDP
jgi:hypothetical protein